ncbi:MAG: ROK family protein [Clostridiales bacterium]|nr:ROK family protein [Clostridiales bacterium]
MYAIGVDIGGMSIKVGLVSSEGKIVEQNRVKTAKTADECIKNIVNQINDLLLNHKLTIDDLSGIGIGCPGAVTSETGVVDFLPNLGWEKVKLVDELKKDFNTNIKISNDANVATLAEVIYGCAKDYNDCVMFTLGTGVGGGIVIDKKLVEGGYSRGAELGHTTLIFGGEPCSCGRSGCVECYCSATALIRQTKTAMLNDRNSKMWEYAKGDLANVDGKTAFECSKLGDNTANLVVENYVAYLSESIINMLNVFRPQAFIIGGGISAQGEYLLDKIKAYCEKFEYGYKNAPKTDILIASLGNDAGIIGAAALVK